MVRIANINTHIILKKKHIEYNHDNITEATTLYIGNISNGSLIKKEMPTEISATVTAIRIETLVSVSHPHEEISVIAFDKSIFFIVRSSSSERCRFLRFMTTPYSGSLLSKDIHLALFNTKQSSPATSPYLLRSFPSPFCQAHVQSQRAQYHALDA